jgi:hypothetical protein
MTDTHRFVVDVQYDADTDDYYIQFTDEMLALTGWQAGDALEWQDLGNQQWQLTRASSEKTPTPST